MKTISLAIDSPDLNQIRKIQSGIIKQAYNLARKGHDFKSIKVLLPQNIDGHLYRSGIQKGIDIHTAAIATGQEKIIFGGRKNFIRRCKGLISKEEWQELRILPLYSIGQANSQGNRRFRLDYSNRKLIYKDSTNEYNFNLPVLKPNWEIILEEISKKSSNNEISLTFTVSKDKVDITYNEELLDCYKSKYQPYKSSKSRYAGIDLNPNRIGFSIYDTKKKEVIYSEQYEFISEDHNKRQNEISHFCNAIFLVMKHYQVSRLGMEELSIKSKDHKKGKKFNKLVNQWIRKFIQDKMRMICRLTGAQFCGICAAYSSFVGTLRNQKLGDCCGAAAEIARRCSYSKTNFYPKLLATTALEHRWKEMAGVVVSNWIELYEAFKIRHLGWRSPPCRVRSSVFGAWSKRLLVHQIGVFSK